MIIMIQYERETENDMTGISRVIFFMGTGDPADYTKAVEWYTKAAEQGDSEAKSKLEQLRQTRR